MIELSVVIATYNRADRLRACLDALAAQTICGGTAQDAFEVVVVVDGSSDGTLELLASYRAKYPLRVVAQENAGQPAALNRGVEEARGRFCLLIDDDVVARPNLLAEHLKAQRETEGVLGAGRLSIDVPKRAGWFVGRFAAEWAGHYARLDSGEKRLTSSSCYGGNLSFPRAAFLAVGGFALDMPRGYDVELAHRLIAFGLSPVYLPNAEGAQDERKTARQLLRDQENAGESLVALYRRDRSTLPMGELTDFHVAGMVTKAFRRILLALDVPAAAFGRTGGVLDRLTRGRWYRFVRQYAFWRGVRRTATAEEWSGLTESVTILLYHAVARAGESRSRFVVDGPEFAWQMRWLARGGYRVVGLGSYVRDRLEHRLTPGRCVIITFDDGYADNGAVAAPILAAQRFGATIFLVTDRVGDANRWDVEGVLAGRPILSWGEIRALEGAGLEFAPHGRSHRAMTDLSDEELSDEIGGAWEALKQEVAHPVPVLAFPFGLHDSSARAASEKQGLIAACTASPGRATLRTPLNALPRLEIRGTTSRLDFRLAMWSGGSWLR